MATLQEIKDTVDARLLTLWGSIQTLEDNFFQASGRYKQFFRTHTITPKDGEENKPSVGTNRPDNESSGWPVSIRNTAIPMSLEIHTYQSPEGHGFVGIVLVEVLGKMYRRSRQVGPETHRNSDWAEVVEDV